MAHPAKKNLGAPGRAAEVNAENGFGDQPSRTQPCHRPQLKRLGNNSSSVAFVDDANGRPMGWLAKGLDGWNAVRFDAHDAWPFPTALKAVRFLIGARP